MDDKEMFLRAQLHIMRLLEIARSYQVLVKSRGSQVPARYEQVITEADRFINHNE